MPKRIPKEIAGTAVSVIFADSMVDGLVKALALRDNRFRKIPVAGIGDVMSVVPRENGEFAWREL